MNCDNFQQQLDELDGHSIPENLQAHADSCAACSDALSAYRTFTLGVQVLKAYPKPPDLHTSIMKKVRGHPQKNVEPFWKTLIKFISPNTAFKASIAYGLAGCLIFVLCSKILQNSPSGKQPIAQPILSQPWELTLLKGTISGTKKPLTLGEQTSLAPGANLQCSPEGEAILRLAMRATIRVRNGKVTLKQAGFVLSEGEAFIEVQKALPDQPFTVTTPLAEVQVIGTRFTLNLCNDILKVRVDCGRVMVRAQGKSKILSAGSFCRVTSQGFPSTDPATGASSTKVPYDRVNTPEE